MRYTYWRGWIHVLPFTASLVSAVIFGLVLLLGDWSDSRGDPVDSSTKLAMTGLAVALFTYAGFGVCGLLRLLNVTFELKEDKFVYTDRFRRATIYAYSDIVKLDTSVEILNAFPATRVTLTSGSILVFSSLVEVDSFIALLKDKSAGGRPHT